MIKANYLNELYKLAVKKKYIVFLIIAIVICFFKVGVSWVISILSEEQLALRSSNIAMTMLPFFAEIYIPLIAFMSVTDLISSEFHDNTIKALLLRPIKRWEIIVTKLMAAVSVCAVYFLVVFLTCTVLEFIFGTPSPARIFAAFASYVLDIIPLSIVALMAVLINMLTNSTTLAMFLSILIYAFFKFVYLFGGAWGSMFFAAYMQWHKIWIGITLPFGALIIKTAILAGWATLLYTTSYILFEKKEF